MTISALLRATRDYAALAARQRIDYSKQVDHLFDLYKQANPPESRTPLYTDENLDSIKAREYPDYLRALPEHSKA